ncbi:MAG TPA: response regulator transcription factor [Anaerolineaceae bacterium]
MNERIRILIVDDHPLIREGLRAILETQPDMELVGEARDGNEAVARAQALKPDVILMDLALPHMDGVEATRQIIQNDPLVRVLILSNYLDDDKVFGVLKAGAKGYLIKETNPQDLRQAVRAVYQGKSALDPAVQRKLVDQFAQTTGKSASSKDNLTEREQEVLRLMAQGLTNPQIGHKLSIAEGTVRFHVSNVLKKLGLKNRTQAVLYAVHNGLADSQSK